MHTRISSRTVSPPAPTMDFSCRNSTTRSRSRVSGGAESIVWTVGYTSGKATAVSDPELSTPNTFVYAGAATTLNQVVDESGPVYASTTYGFDPLGRVTSETDPEGDGTTRGFDPDSNLTSVLPLDDHLGPARQDHFRAGLHRLLPDVPEDVVAAGDVEQIREKAVAAARVDVLQG